MTRARAAFERLLARRKEPYGASQSVRRRFRYDQMCDMHGVKGAPEEGFARHAVRDWE